MLLNRPPDNDITPINVLVKDGRWDAYGHNPPTARDAWLFQILSGMGGVNESVPDGLHIFNADIVDGILVLSLVPAPPVLST